MLHFRLRLHHAFLSFWVPDAFPFVSCCPASLQTSWRKLRPSEEAPPLREQLREPWSGTITSNLKTPDVKASNAFAWTKKLEGFHVSSWILSLGMFLINPRSIPKSRGFKMKISFYCRGPSVSMTCRFGSEPDSHSLLKGASGGFHFIPAILTYLSAALKHILLKAAR